ncbi:MAG: hypothetical protein ABIR91_01965 [Candidatus Saccharimonadales bacterium]
MLGWDYNFYRGGHIIDDQLLKVVDGKFMLAIPPTSDFTTYNVLCRLAESNRATRTGDGYPYIWRLHACDLEEVLATLDNRPTTSWDNNRSAKQQIAMQNLPGDEVVFVEAWDQS